MQRRLIPTWLVFFCSWLSFMGLCFLNASAQNYIISRTYKDGQAADAGNVAKTTTQVQYMDGLGRPIQQVAVGQSPTGKDIIVHQAYDAYGREPKQFLPFTDAGSAGSFRSNASSLQNTFYGSNTLQFSPADNTRPYNETTFESSPLNRPLEQQAPGQSSYSYLAYGVNNNTNALTTVKRYDFQEHTNLENTVVANGNYINGQLSFVKVTDENGKIAVEFKDKLGQVILKRAVVEGSTFADTYYVYDDLGQLRAVLQPMYQNESSTHKFAFLYRYDDRGRLTEKQVPGAESVEMRYDQYDRLVLSRDGNQRVRDTWSFTKYDALNRPIVTGEINNSVAPTPLQLLSNGHHETLTGAGEVKYSLTATLPSLSDESGVLNVTYYDNYTNWGALAYADQYSLTPHTALKGQTTGARSRMLNPDGSYGDFLISTIYYDDNYRPIQTIKQLFGFLGENDPVLRVSIQYKYAIATVIAKEREQQGTSSSVVSIEKEYGYDHADRLLWVKHQITRDGITQPQVTLAATDYNELGQLNQKWLHSTDGAKFRRQTAYTYSIRGWQTAGHTVLKKQDQISAQTQFKYLLAYGQGGGTYTNGNISDMSWEDYDDTHNGGYSFSYDGLNRLMSTGSAGGTNEGGLGYDLNGNLNTLKRWQNGTLIDDLTYHYSQGNRLNGIVDHSSHVAGFKEASTGGMGSYAYDANGNLTQDLNKGIAVGNLQYNLLNLVRQITIDSSTLAYYYDASGQKHQLVYSNTADVTKSESTRYAGSVEWEGNHLKRIATGDGQYIYKTSSTGEYQYYLNDHLRNTRIVVTDSGKVLQRTDYYAFGLQIPHLPTTSDSLRLVNKYLFLDRELQPETGYFDLKLRQYDPTKARFDNVDSKPDQGGQESLSTYQYGWNNPMLRSDPNGDCPECPDNDPFLIAKLAVTALFDTKHAIYNTAARLVGSNLRAEYKVEDGSQVFETVYNTRISDNSFTGQVREVASAGLDLMQVGPLKGGNLSGTLLSQTGTTQTTKGLKNAIDGAARETAELIDLQKAYPNASVQSQRYLRDKNGKSVKDPLTGERRRVDFAVIQNGKAIDMVETTSKTANKTSQMQKEARIRAAGGVYIRDKSTKQLVDVNEILTRISKRD